MSSRYYAPGSTRSERVRELFSRIAARYDLINDLQSFGLHRLWKRKLVSLGALTGSESVLDVCCGTGDLALQLSRKAGSVVAADFTPEMLLEGKKRGGKRISWVQADALALPFQSESFDLVTIGYGLRNLASLEAGVRELFRVLKPGGRILVLDFGKPQNPVLRACYFGYLRLVVPLFGWIFCGDRAAYDYIIESLHAYPAQEGVTRLLEEQAGVHVRVRNFVGGAMSLHSAEKPLLGQRHNVPLETGAFLT